MFKTSFRLALYIITVLTLGAAFLWPIKVVSGGILQVSAHNQSLPPNSNIDSSTSGISITVLSLDRSGGIWLGGSVFGVEGLLLKSKAQMTQALTIDSVEYIRDLSFSSPQRGWMIADGSLYQTKNAGKSWDRVKTLSSTIRPRSVWFADRFVGWVAGQDGLVFRTRDGGLTWSEQHSGTDFTIDRIRFVNKD